VQSATWPDLAAPLSACTLCVGDQIKQKRENVRKTYELGVSVGTCCQRTKFDAKVSY